MPQDRDDLLELLVRRAIRNEEPFQSFEPALRSLVGAESAPTLTDIATALDDADDPALVELRGRTELRLLRLARRAHLLRQEGRSWTTSMESEFGELDLGSNTTAAQGLDRLEQVLLHLYRDEREAYAAAISQLDRADVPWEHVPWEGLCEVNGLGDLRLGSATPESVIEQRPSGDLSRAEHRKRALASVLRLGTQGPDLDAVLRNDESARDAARKQLDERGARYAERTPEILAQVIADLSPEVGHELRARIHAAAAAKLPSASATSVPMNVTPQMEVTVNPEGGADEPAETATQEDVPAVLPQAEPASAAPSRAALEPKIAPPKRPSVWRSHLQPFLLDNWYIAVGAIMVVAGSSLVAYFTWEKHWAVRYTVLPILLGAFTATLARLGAWLERQDATLTGTGAVLRGAAIALLPANCMTVALLADDEISNKAWLVPLVAAVYLGLFGIGLRRWCSAVHPRLGGLLGGTLVGLCALVVLEPLATAWAFTEVQTSWLLGIGFYVGFAGLALSLIRFLSSVLTEDLARERRVPWFFGATLVITFLQVFGWVHASIGHLPRVFTYAPMLILAGALLLRTERRVIALTGRPDKLRSESFLGYALVLLGLLMAQGHAYVRIGGFALAGLVWLRQAVPARHALHAWIGLTLLTFAGASVTLVEGFPPELRPWAGLMLALMCGAASHVVGKRGLDVIARAARNLQAALLVLTSVVAMLAQWHDDTPPLWTALLLAISASALFVRAHRDGRERWVVTASVLLAATLPYLGFVDLAGRTWVGNTMVFGLGALSMAWILVDRLCPTTLTRRSRSTVLWFYGGLAVAAMTLRVFLESGTRTPWLDNTGPFLCALALVFATYWSRSLIPAAMAAVILVILFPELQSNYEETFDRLGWGTGLGGGVSAVLLVVAVSLLRRWPRLRELGEGDQFLGRGPFPMRRNDWTLFTWPIVASVLFLITKTGTIVLVQNYDHGMGTKAAAAQVLCGLAWLGLGAFGRRTTASPWAVRAGLLTILIGVFSRVDDKDHVSTALLVAFGGLQALALAIHNFGPAWGRSVLVAPMARCVRWSVLGTLPLVLFLVVAPFEVPARTHLLVALSAAVLIVNGARGGRWVYGFALFPLIWIEALYWSLPTTRAGDAEFWRVTDWHLLVTTASVVLGIQVPSAALRGSWSERLRPVVQPLHLWSMGCALLLVAGSFDHAFGGVPYNLPGLAVLAASVLAVAWSHRSGVFFVLGSWLAFLLCQGLPESPSELVQPWRLGLFACWLAGAGHLARSVPRAWSSGKDLLRIDRIPPAWTLATCAAVVALSVVPIHAARSSWYEAHGQLAAMYLAAIAWFLAGRLVQQRWTGYVVIALATLGNVHVVRVWPGAWLHGHEISQAQMIGMGMAATLIAAWVLRRRIRATDIVDRAASVLSVMLLVLIVGQYVARPTVVGMNRTRLIVSGLLAYSAAFTFRSLARRPWTPPAVSLRFAESAYHLGVTVAIWCGFLMIEWFQQPSRALVALSVPFFYFVLRADLLRATDRRTAMRYVESASLLGFFLLGLYLLRGIFQLILFPGEPVLTSHYHHNAPLVMAVGLGLLRLHRHGLGEVRAFLGGIALMVGSYFALTWFEGLSVFQHVVPASWALIAVCLFWTVAQHQRSPLRVGLQRFAGIDDAQWAPLARSWGYVVLVAGHWPGILVASTSEPSTTMLAPLLVATAGLVIYHGVLRGMRAYFVVAAAELLLALHMDLLADSYLPWKAIVWILLGLWGALFAWDLLAAKRLPWAIASTIANVLAVFIGGHIALHGPASHVGLFAFTLGVLLMLMTPRDEAQWSHDRGDLWTPALLLAPAWLAYFGQGTPYEFADSWPRVTAALALLGTGAAAAWLRANPQELPETDRPRLIHRLFDLVLRHGDSIARAALYPAFVVALGTLALHYREGFETRVLVGLSFLFAGCVVGFHHDGRSRRAMLPYYLLQVAVAAFFIAIRRQLMFADVWNVEYDVWVACAVTAGLAGAKEVLDLRPREVSVPVTSSLLLMPVVALVWTSVHPDLGSREALLVLGINSLAYSFMGRDDRESPYNLGAVAGFVGFVILTFWSELGLHSIQAYVIPVGIGILVLSQFFRARLSAGVRTQVRFVASMAMIGSSAYEALIDPTYPIAFHISLMLLGLAGLTLGGVLRVRVYLWTGCASVMVALGSITYRGMVGMEKATRMSAIGILILILGAGLVASAIYYKTHRERVNTTLDRIRRKLGEWD